MADQDGRPWGAQYWLWNEEALYEPMLAANQISLTDPYYRMYFNQLPRAEIAARQRWGVRGAFYPETVSYDGPLELSETVAAQVRDILLAKASVDSLGREASRSTYDSQLWALNRTYPKYFAGGRYSFTLHILSSGSELALQFWRRYEYTQDREWLAGIAYPLMKAVSQFYLDYAKLGDDGKYHIFPTNAHESFWGARDAITDLAAIRGLFPRCIHAAELLGLDADLRQQWSAFLQNLTPYPDGADPEAIRLKSSLGPGTWAAALYGEVPGRRNYEEVWTAPVYPFYAVTPETSGKSSWNTALATYKALPQRLLLTDPTHSSVSADWAVPGHSRIAPLSAFMRQPQDVAKIIPEFAIANNPGFGGAPGDAETGGLTAYAIQTALLQTTNDVTRVFPAWPDEWDAEFELLAPGAFLVSSSKQHGVIQFVAIKAQIAKTCKLANPWSGAVRVIGGATRNRLDSDVLEIPMKAGQTVVVTKMDASAITFPLRPAIRPTEFPLKIKVVAPDLQVFTGQLGN